MSNKALVYIHGKGGTASDSAYFKPLFPEYDTYGFDYKSENPWEAESEYKEYFAELSEKYSSISVIASSLGAYFLMISDVGSVIEKAFFISPIVNMERLIQDMMERADISDEVLKTQKHIQISADEILSWEYLTWVRKHPVVWKVPTYILYGEKDNLQSIETMTEFAKAIDAELTVMPNGEHWFHTDEQIEFRLSWINKYK